MKKDEDSTEKTVGNSAGTRCFISHINNGKTTEITLKNSWQETKISIEGDYKLLVVRNI